ncbi:MAG: alpha/beta hydrolase family protein [Pirellulaceae bacterium]
MTTTRNGIEWATAVLVLAVVGLFIGLERCGCGEPLAGTSALEDDANGAAEMVVGIERYLTRELAVVAEQRRAKLTGDRVSTDVVASAQDRLRRILGVVDPRPPRVELELLATTTQSALIAEDDDVTIVAVRWSALDGIEGEGLLLTPRGDSRAAIIALPDADWTPEMLAGLVPDVPAGASYALWLARAGCEVLVPTLINRDDTFSGNPVVRMTNQPHREYVYRMAYQLGRHIVGYEIQKVLAAVDHFASRAGSRKPIGVMGYGEGGMVALYSAALDSRIDATVVSGYFAPREGLWAEPIYRNVWSLLREFGDAEVAALIAPRALVVEASRGPLVVGPPPASEGRQGAAPGRLESPALEDVRAEFERVQRIYESLGVGREITLTCCDGGSGPPGATETLEAFLAALGLHRSATSGRDLSCSIACRRTIDIQARQKRQLEQLIEFTQTLARQAESRRREFWSKADPTSPQVWHESCAWYRRYLWDEVLGRLPDPSMPMNPRTRLTRDMPAWRSYDVVLDVWPDVCAQGVLLVPGDLRPGERRPLVVCQHGLEGEPYKAIDAESAPTYRMFAARLAERGFIVYAPQNPYTGGDRFRTLQRRANPLKLSLYSFILGQHARTLEWLGSLPFVDPQRIGYYGISYGGRTGMLVPSLLDRQYAATICSANFNEWIWKTTSVTFPATYIFTGEYEMFDFDVGNTFNHAELAGMIAPRPFMVERGHHDNVGLDEQVAYEYAKVARLYSQLGISDRTDIEYFDGAHEIHGQGTFRFLHRCLDWPEP